MSRVFALGTAWRSVVRAVLNIHILYTTNTTCFSGSIAASTFSHFKEAIKTLLLVLMTTNILISGVYVKYLLLTRIRCYKAHPSYEYCALITGSTLTLPRTLPIWVTSCHMPKCCSGNWGELQCWRRLFIRNFFLNHSIFKFLVYRDILHFDVHYLTVFLQFKSHKTLE